MDLAQPPLTRDINYLLINQSDVLSVLKEVVPMLDNDLGLLNMEYCYQVIEKEVAATIDSKAKTIAELKKYPLIILCNSLSNAKKDKAAQDVEEANSKLLSFIYFIIAKDLEEKNLQGAHYYYESAYKTFPENLSNPYQSMYGRSSIKIEPNASQAEKDAIAYVLSSVDKKDCFPKEEGVLLADIKLIILTSVSFSQIKEKLSKLLEEKNPKFRVIIEAERAWIDLCEYAKNYQSTNQSVNDTLLYLKNTIISDYPSLCPADLKLPEPKNLGEAENKELLEKLEAIEQMRNSDRSLANIVSLDRVHEALRIYHGELTPDNPNRRKAKECLVQSLRNNNSDSFYYFYQHYDSLIKDPEILALYPECTEKEKEQIYFLEMAAWNGNREAQYFIANHYFKSAEPVEEGLVKTCLNQIGEYFLQLAAANDVGSAQYDLAMMIKSEKIIGSYALEIGYLERAALNQHPDALQEIANQNAETYDELTPDDSVSRRKLISSLKKYGSELNDPFEFIDSKERVNALISVLENPGDLQSLYYTYLNQYNKAKRENPLDDTAIKKARSSLDCFLYHIIHQNDPDLNYYAELAYRSSTKSTIGDLNIIYNYIIFLEESSPNLGEKRTEQLILLNLIAATEKQPIDQSQDAIGLARIKLTLIKGKNFKEIITSLKAIAKDYPKLSQNIETQIAWIEFYKFSQKFLLDDKIVSHAQFIIEQEFVNLSNPNGQAEKIPLDEKDKQKLYELCKKARDLGLKTPNNQIFNRNRIYEFSKIINDTLALRGTYAKTEIFISSLRNRDPEALYYAYTNYSFFAGSLPIDLNHPQDYFLIQAALKGNSLAQHEVAKVAERESFDLQQKIASEQDPIVLASLNESLKFRQEKFRYFLQLSANNDNRLAIFDLADCLALSDDPKNHDRLNFIKLDRRLEFIYYKKASLAGHSVATTKYNQELERIKSLDLSKISSDEFEYLQQIYHYDEHAAMACAICYEEGFGVEKNVDKAIECYSALSSSFKEAIFRLALLKLPETDDPLIKFLESTKTNRDLLSFCARLIEKELSPQIKSVIICQLSQLKPDLSANKKQRQEEFNAINEIFQKLHSQQFLPATIELAKILILQNAKPGEDVFANKKQAFVMLLDVVEKTDSDEIKAQAAEQMLILLSKKEIIFDNITIEQIAPFLKDKFLTSEEAKKIDPKKTLGSILQFKLAENIEKFAKKKSDPDQSNWKKVAVDLTVFSANSTNSYQPAKEKTILYFDQELYKPDLKTITKWREDGTIKTLLPPRVEKIADYIYEAGKKLTDPDLKKYKSELRQYLKLVGDEKRLQELKEKYPDWLAKEGAEVATTNTTSTTAAVTLTQTTAAATTTTKDPEKEKEKGKKTKKQATKAAKPTTTESATKTAGANPAIASTKPATAEDKKPQKKEEVAAKAKVPEQKAAAHKSTEESRSQEMESFLSNKKPIESMEDLPPFIQDVLSLGLPQMAKQIGIAAPTNTLFYITGSCSYNKNSDSKFLPADLDMTFILAGISRLEKPKIESLVQKLLPFKDVKINIYNGEGGFTVNIDYGKWQISIYDPLKQNKAPSWSSSLDATITSFDKDDNAVKNYNPEFNNYRTRCGDAPLPLVKELILNPFAKGFITRSALLAAKELVPDHQSIINAIQKALHNRERLSQNPSPIIPAYQILEDLGITISDSPYVKNSNKEKVSQFLQKHITEELKQPYLDVLRSIINSDSGINDTEKAAVLNALNDAFEKTLHPITHAKLGRAQSKIIPIIDPANAQQGAAAATTTSSPSTNPQFQAPHSKGHHHKDRAQQFQSNPPKTKGGLN